MKIVQIMATDGGKIGGLEKHTFQLCSKLAETQEVHLFLDKDYAGKIPEKNHIYCHYFNFSKGRTNLGLLYCIFKSIKKIQPDIVHAQGGKASKILGFILTFLKIPSVATIHGMKNNIRSYRIFNEVIVVSKSVAKKAQLHRSVYVIYNGVDSSKTSVKEHNLFRLPKKAIAIGRLDPVKGFDQLIEAWQGIDLQLEIIGEGAERQYLEQLITQFNLTKNVKLIGYQKDIYSYLAESDFVIVSSSKEGGPLIVAEALLENKPVIATDVGMASEFIPIQYIARGYRAPELKDLIQFTIANFEYIQQDFQPAFNKAKEQLSLDTMVEATLNVYLSAIKNAS